MISEKIEGYFKNQIVVAGVSPLQRSSEQDPLYCIRCLQGAFSTTKEKSNYQNVVWFML